MDANNELGKGEKDTIRDDIWIWLLWASNWNDRVYIDISNSILLGLFRIIQGICPTLNLKCCGHPNTKFAQFQNFNEIHAHKHTIKIIRHLHALPYQNPPTSHVHWGQQVYSHLWYPCQRNNLYNFLRRKLQLYKFSLSYRN